MIEAIRLGMHEGRHMVWFLRSSLTQPGDVLRGLKAPGCRILCTCGGTVLHAASMSLLGF